MSDLDRKKLVPPHLVDIFHKDTKIVGNLNKKIKGNEPDVQYHKVSSHVSSQVVHN